MSDISDKIMSIEAEPAPAAKSAPAPNYSKPERADTYVNSQAEGSGAVTIIAWICALLWIIAIAVAAWLWAGADSLLNKPAPVLAGLTALAIIPALLFVLLGAMAKRVLSAAARSEALIAAADSLTRPDNAAQARVTALAQGIRSQIIGVDAELKAALDRLAGMENVLRGHTEALQGSHLAATRQTGDIAARLSEEREGLKEISSNFDERMGALSRLLSEHSDRLAQATQIAEQKIQEARVSVEGAAAKINASSEIVRENALAATDSLQAGETKISSLGESIKAQAGTLDEINAKHAKDMADLVSRLEEEQSRMRETMDARLESMRDMSLSAKLSAESLNEAGDAGRRTIEALAESASLADNAVRERFKEMEDMVNFSATKAESITDRAAQRVRDSLSLTRLEISRIEDDMRALEQRLTDRSDDFERRETAVDITPKPGRMRSLLRFRPADNEDPAPLSLTPLQDNMPSAPAPIDTAAQQPLEIPQAQSPSKGGPVTEAVSDLVSSGEPQTTAEPPAAMPADAADVPEELHIHTPPDPVLPIDLPQVPTLSSSRIDPPQLRARKEKSGWSLKSLFGGNAAEETPQVLQDNFADWDERCADMTASLTGQGLSPAAVVEAGTIIEAVNMRVAQGPDAMRKTVAMRLTEPVSHLQGVFSNNPDLRIKAEHFATRFYQVIAEQGRDREAIRGKLETDAGRAFLLCDAALG